MGMGCGCKGGGKNCDCPDCKRNRGEFHPIRREGKGKAEVIAKSTGKPLERHPIPLGRARAQLRAIEARKRGY